MDFAHVLLSHRPLIGRITQALTARYRMSPADVDDFISTVQLRLIENDYAVLRAYQGRSEWSTYLFAVIRRQLHDWHRAQWGRWRPSAGARRLGPDAILLERLLSVDGLTMAEADEVMRSRYGVERSAKDLDEMAAKLTVTPGREFVSDDALAAVPAADGAGDRLVKDRDLSRLAARMTQLLHAAMAALTVDDRLILQLRFEQNLSVAAIARMLNVEPKSLYRRMDRALSTVRAHLVDAGVAEADVNVVLRAQGFDLLEGDEGRPA